MDLLKLLTDIASGAFTGPLSREIANLLKERLDLSEKALRESDEKLRNAERRIAELVKSNRDAEEQLASVLVSEDYAEHAGVLWKRSDGGGYSPQPVCPMCRAPLNVVMHNFGLRCGPCKFTTIFKGSDLVRIHSEIPV